MLENYQLITEFTRGLSQEEYGKSRLIQYGVERAALTISEAARRIDVLIHRKECPEDIVDRIGKEDWHAIKAIGNILRHDYDEILLDSMWELARGKVDALTAALQSILNDQT